MLDAAPSRSWQPSQLHTEPSDQHQTNPETRHRLNKERDIHDQVVGKTAGTLCRNEAQRDGQQHCQDKTRTRKFNCRG